MAQFTSQRRRLFLNTLAATGNVSASARAAQISRSHCYRVRHADPDFAQQWQDAEAEALDEVLASVRQRVIKGDPRPLVVGGKLVKDDDGEVVMVHEYDNKLVEMYLKALAPEKFRDNSGGKPPRGPTSLPPVRIIIAAEPGSAAASQAGIGAAD